MAELYLLKVRSDEVSELESRGIPRYLPYLRFDFADICHALWPEAEDQAVQRTIWNCGAFSFEEVI